MIPVYTFDARLRSLEGAFEQTITQDGNNVQGYYLFQAHGITGLVDSVSYTSRPTTSTVTMVGQVTVPDALELMVACCFDRGSFTVAGPAEPGWTVQNLNVSIAGGVFSSAWRLGSSAQPCTYSGIDNNIALAVVGLV